MSDALCGSRSPDIHTDRSFTLLIIFHWFKPKSNKANQERERNLYTKFIFIWKTSSRFGQCRLSVWGTRRVITEKYSSSSVETCGGPITRCNGAYIHRATKVVGRILGHVGLPENLLKKRPAVLHLTLLLCDAGSQGGMEIRQLGHAHI